ncbi:tape measure protein [Leuconostoc mesenteroides]|uniref:tape measure protein n=1 Tax=Leuconostoc mesenteroides TaxID=1245 RepID=UPI0015F386EA|nr:tape measure protein [Leuconostoc mesenteroides]MBA5972500.1 tape measure protein [Leuconostoc mesenteroides]
MADGSINIDLLLNDQTDKTWSEFKSKAETAGKSGYDEFKDAFKGDPLVAKLETKANKAGIKNFRELLNQLPKEKQTELLTKAEKGEVINYEKLLREIPSKITSQVELNDNASTGLRSLKNQAEEVGDKFHRLKDIAIGTFVGSTISAGVRTVAGFISGLGQEALNSSDALQKFKSTMQLGGFGEDEIDKATKQVKKYADDTVYDLNTVSNTTAQLAANGVKDYLGLTEAAGNLNAQAGGNADTFKSVAMVLTQTAGAGKLTTENWNQMADAIPGASGVLQKALKENGAFTGNFRDAMADGQITADEFNDALTKLGSNDAAKKAATSTNTFEGAWGSLEANVVSGLDNMINKIGKKNLTGIINQLADVSTNAFGAMGKAVGNVIQFIEKNKNTIVAVFGGIKDVVVQVFGLIGNALSLFSISFKANVLGAVSDGKVGEKVNGIKKAFDGLVEAIKPIASAVGGFVGVLAGGVVSTIVKVVQGIADGFVNVGNSADKSKKKLDFTAIFGIIIKLSQSLNDVFTVLGEIAKPLGEIIGSIASGAFEAFSDIIGLIVDGLKHLSGQAKEASDKTNPLAKGLKSVAKHKKALEAVGLAVGAIATAMIAVKGVVGVFKMVSSGITTVRIAVMLLGDTWKALNAIMKANIFVIIVTAIVALGIAFYELYKHNKKFKKFVDDCVDAAANFFKGIGKWFGKATKAVGKFFKGLGKWFKNIGKSIGSGSNAIGKWFDGLVKGFVKGWNKFVNTAVKLAKGFGKLLLYALAVPVGLVIVITKPLVKPLKKIFNSLIKWIKKAWSGTVKFLSKIWEPVAKTWNKAWKLIQKAFEFVWKILSKFIKNEFNFWKKLFTVTLNFITKAWNKAWNAVSKTFESIWNGIKKFFKPIIDWFGDVISDTLKAIKKIWNKTWDSISDFFSDTWNGIKKFGSKAVNSLKDTFDDVLGKIGKSFGDTWTGVKNGFSDMWDGMKKLAGDGINAVIKIPNAGIDGINGLIHDFGGPKNALGKIPKVKFANGTGAINQLTHAILNDGNDSPETGNKETLIHPNGKMEIVQGRNTERLLLPGTEVLNASETAMMMGMSGTKHFAGGTGFWSKLISGAGSTISNVAGSLWGGLKNGVDKFTKMFSYITGAVADPSGTLGKVLNLKSGGVSSVMDGMAGGAYKKVTSTAKDWWSTMWSMANESSSSGTGSKGDDYAYKNKSKDSGVDPWGYFYRECVSFVASRLKNMGVSADLFSHLGNGADWVNASVPHSKTPKVGDVAVYGAGSEFGNHAAMVTGVQGDKISGEEYNWSGDGQYHTYNGRKASGATTFLDFGRSAGAKAKEVATNNPLSKLIKKQTGGMMEWIQKFIAPINDSSTGTDSDVQSWSGDVKKALSKLGLSTSGSMVSKILKQIQTESSGNAKAIGGNDGLADGNATGLMQVKPGTFKAYAVDGHNNIMNGYDNILAGLNYAKHRYGSDLSFLGQGHGYANGGRTNGIGVVGEVQGEDEWVTNPNRSTADKNIIGSIKETAQKQPNSFAAKLAGVINGAKSGMQAITSQQPIIAGSSSMQSTNGGIDLSGDVHMTVQLDSGEIARATYPKIKVLQNQEIQMKGQVTGNTYVY